MLRSYECEGQLKVKVRNNDGLGQGISHLMSSNLMTLPKGCFSINQYVNSSNKEKKSTTTRNN